MESAFNEEILSDLELPPRGGEMVWGEVEANGTGEAGSHH